MSLFLIEKINICLIINKFFMKRFVFILLGITFMFNACNVSMENNMSEEKTDFSYELVGDIHNRGLMYVINNLNIPSHIKSRVNIGTPLDPIDYEYLLNEVDSLCVEYVEQEMLIADLEVREAYALYGGKEKLKQDIESIEIMSESDIMIDLASEAELYYEQLTNLLNDSTIALRALHSDLDILQTEVENSTNLLEKDKSIILSAISVAKYSSEYWEDNDNYWGEKCGYTNYTLSGIERSNLWRSDVAGGALMGINMWANGSAGILLGLGPKGWLAMGMVLGGAALQSSAVEFIFRCFN